MKINYIFIVSDSTKLDVYIKSKLVKATSLIAHLWLRYLQETPRISGCAQPDCQQAAHRLFWLVCMTRLLQTSEAKASNMVLN